MSEEPITRATLLIQIRDAENHQAWKTFADIYMPIIYGFCRKHGLQDADAADVAQQVMSAVAKSIRSFEYDPTRGSFRMWLLVVTKNKLINHFSGQRRQAELVGEAALLATCGALTTPPTEVDWDREYRRRLFEWAAERVRREVQPATWRLFWLTTIEGRSCQEVAAQQQVSLAVVYAARSRVLARLKTHIAEVADDDSALSALLP